MTGGREEGGHEYPLLNTSAILVHPQTVEQRRRMRCTGTHAAGRECGADDIEWIALAVIRTITAMLQPA